MAATVLMIHLTWLLFVIFGALLTRGRPTLTCVHISALLWGVAVEIGPWACPLTALEQEMQRRARMDAYDGAFLVHYLDRLVYPNISPALLAAAAVAVCGFNLAVYVRRLLLQTRHVPEPQ
jgi:hypothetical protein